MFHYIIAFSTVSVKKECLVFCFVVLGNNVAFFFLSLRVFILLSSFLLLFPQRPAGNVVYQL